MPGNKNKRTARQRYKKRQANKANTFGKEQDEKKPNKGTCTDGGETANKSSSLWTAPLQLIPTNQLPHCMKFTRNKQECFSNAAIQGLLSLDPVRTILNQPYAENSVCWWLREFVTLENMGKKRARSAVRLRQLASGVRNHPYTNGEQQDADEFLSDLLQHVAVPVELLHCMTFQSTTHRICSVCNLEGAPVSNPEQRLSLRRRDENHMTFESLFHSEVTKKCDNINCPSHNINTLHREFLEVQIPDHTECLVVMLTLFRYDQAAQVSRRMKGAILEFNPERQNIGGVEFRTVGAIQHIGPSASIGHYTCWRRIHNGWVHLSDSEEIVRLLTLPANLCNIKLLFMQRIH